MGEIYIKMCKKAEEIQASYKPAEWDYVYCEKEQKVVVLSGYETDGGFYGHALEDGAIIYGWESEGTRHFLIPNQSQLQRMIHYDTIHDLIFDLMCFTWRAIGGGCFEEQEEYALQFGTLRQILLAFVMDKNYNKRWDGEQWILRPQMPS